MNTSHAETSAGRKHNSAVLIWGALGGVVVLSIALPLALSNSYPTPNRSDWVIEPAAKAAPTAAISATTPAVYEVASLSSVAIDPPRAVPAIAFAEPEEPDDIQAAIPAPAETTSTVTRVSSLAPTSVLARGPSEAASSAVMKIPVAQQAAPIDRQPVIRVSFAERWTSAMVVPEVAATIQMPAEAARLETPERRAAPAPAKRRDIGMMDEVDRYLWEVYQRKAVKSDSSGDFSWKDPAAAKHAGLSMQDYVIRGMDADFREQLYHAGRAMDGQGISWSMLSAFRDDYRQNLASGFKAHGGNSKHGGSRATGGYGHGQAIDLTTADGDGSAAWHWIDAHGAKYGLHRPIPGPDPAHVQPSAKWHDIAVALRNSRARIADSEPVQSKTKVAGATR